MLMLLSFVCCLMGLVDGGSYINNVIMSSLFELRLPQLMFAFFAMPRTKDNKETTTNKLNDGEREGGGKNKNKKWQSWKFEILKYFRFQFIILIRPQWIQWILPQQRSASQKWPSLSAHNMKENKPRGLLWKLFCACHGVRCVFPGRYTLLSHCL